MFSFTIFPEFSIVFSRGVYGAFQPLKTTEKIYQTSVFLPPSPTDHTLKAGQQIRLLKLGLGHRIIIMEEDAGHDEVNIALQAKATGRT